MCDARFLQKACLKTHVRGVHNHKKPFNYVWQKAYLDVHISSVHLKERPYDKCRENS